MTGLEQVYLGCFILGLLYTLFAAITSGMFGGHDVDVSGHDFHADVGDHSGPHADVDSGLHFSPLSPVVVATFVCSFGGVGLVGTQLFHLGYFSLLLPTPTGLVLAGLVFLFFNKVFSLTQSSSEARVAFLVGKEAEVIVAVPAEGLGEIAYSSKGARYNASARSSTGKPIPKNSLVTIDRVVGTTFYVKPHVDEEFRQMGQQKESE